MRSTLTDDLQCLLLVGSSAWAKGKTDGDTAAVAARESYPANTLNNGIGDVVLHCYWNSLMPFSFGRDIAKKVVDLHEDNNTTGPLTEDEMD